VLQRDETEPGAFDLAPNCFMENEIFEASFIPFSGSKFIAFKIDRIEPQKKSFVLIQVHDPTLWHRDRIKKNHIYEFAYYWKKVIV
jgi:hypothetical protein